MSKLRRELDVALRTHLHLPDVAASWLLHLWDAIQFLDDVVDGEKIEREAADNAIWALLVQMPANSFFAANAPSLLPLIAQAILRWQASDKAEREGRADAKSFGWRADYYGIVLQVYLLVFGAQAARENAERILRLYGERFEDYMKEKQHA